MSSTSADRRFGVNAGKAIKVPCRAATTINITLSGEQTIDGVACISGERVLVKNQTTATENGIYSVDTGAWTRAADFNDSLDLTKGTLVAVTDGTTNTNTTWRVTNYGVITFGSTSISFEQALLTSSSSSSFLQAGTGAVSRPAQNKMREHPSFFDYFAPEEIADAEAGTFNLDLTSSMMKAINATSGDLEINIGSYNFTQLSIPRYINLIGKSIEKCLLRSQHTADAIVTSAGWFEQRFMGFTLSHAGNTNPGVNLMRAKHGANGCKFDLQFIGQSGSSVGALVLEGVNPDTGLANNLCYNNMIRGRFTRNGSTEVAGSALYLHGQSITNGRANSNHVFDSVFTGWSNHIWMRGTNNIIDHCTINNSSDAGVIISGTTINECGGTEIRNGTTFDGAWTGDKVRLINESNTKETMLIVKGGNLRQSDVVNSGTYATSIYTPFATINCNVVAGASANTSFDLSSGAHGASGVNDTGVRVEQSGSSTANAKLLISGSGYGGSQAITAGGITRMIMTTGEDRVVTTTDGTSVATQLGAWTGAGALRFGASGAGEITLQKGSGSPEGVVTARPGSMYFDYTNGDWYQKHTLTGNTGWVLK